VKRKAPVKSPSLISARVIGRRDTGFATTSRLHDGVLTPSFVQNILERVSPIRRTDRGDAARFFLHLTNPQEALRTVIEKNAVHHHHWYRGQTSRTEPEVAEQTDMPETGSPLKVRDLFTLQSPGEPRLRAADRGHSKISRSEVTRQNIPPILQTDPTGVKTAGRDAPHHEPALRTPSEAAPSHTIPALLPLQHAEGSAIQRQNTVQVQTAGHGTESRPSESAGHAPDTASTRHTHHTEETATEQGRYLAWHRDAHTRIMREISARRTESSRCVRQWAERPVGTYHRSGASFPSFVTARNTPIPSESRNLQTADRPETVLPASKAHAPSHDAYLQTGTNQPGTLLPASKVTLFSTQVCPQAGGERGTADRPLQLLHKSESAPDRKPEPNDSREETFAASRATEGHVHVPDPVSGSENSPYPSSPGEEDMIETISRKVMARVEAMWRREIMRRGGTHGI
jgi:hypothetical protein